MSICSIWPPESGQMTFGEKLQPAKVFMPTSGKQRGHPAYPNKIASYGVVKARNAHGWVLAGY